MMSLEKCRTCYNDVESENLIRLDTIDLLLSISLETKLNQCVPELEINAIKEKICRSCVNLLSAAYNFRKLCLQTEATLKSKNCDVTTTSIKSEPPEVFVPLNIVKTEVNSEEHVIHDLTSEENISAGNNSSEMDNLHTFGRDVITGDISVGFEITNAKQIHNTVSVSFITNSENSCRFQTETCSELESSMQSNSKQLDHRTETVEAENHVVLETNVQCKPGLSDKEIAANFLKTRPSLRRKNIMNTAIKLKKLTKSVLLALTKNNQKVYTCDFCEDVLITRSRLHKHNAKHLRRITYEQLENLGATIKKRKFRNSPSRPPPKKIKTEMEDAEVNSSLYNAALQSPGSSHLPLLSSEADSRNSKTNSINVSRSPNKADIKPKGNTKESERFHATTPKKNVKSRIEHKSPVNTQLLMAIKTEPLELSETEMKCEFCDITFCSSNMFNLHMSLHPNENKHIKKPKKHVCVVCKASFDLRVQLNGHMSSHSVKRLVKNNAKQSEVITSNKEQSSQFVGEPSTTHKGGAGLNKSVNLKNKKTGGSSEEKSLKVIECKICSRKFNTVYHYNVHSCLRVNVAQKMLKCEVCQNYFIGRNAFLEHVKTHLNGFTTKLTY